MRILLLTHRMPFPPDRGDKIRSFNLLAYLSRRHEVYLASLLDDSRDLVHIPQVRQRVAGFVYELIGRGLRKLLCLRGLLLGSSATVTRSARSPSMSTISSREDSDSVTMRLER